MSVEVINYISRPSQKWFGVAEERKEFTPQFRRRLNRRPFFCATRTRLNFSHELKPATKPLLELKEKKNRIMDSMVLQIYQVKPRLCIKRYTTNRKGGCG